MIYKVKNNNFKHIFLTVLFFVVTIIALLLFSGEITKPNYCDGEIKCYPKGSCSMMSNGFCDIRNCASSHTPISTKHCVKKGNEDRECEEIKSLVNDCQDFCHSIPLVVCSCEVKEGDGGWIVKDCDVK
jgi:hypothetical protein